MSRKKAATAPDSASIPVRRTEVQIPPGATDAEVKQLEHEQAERNRREDERMTLEQEQDGFRQDPRGGTFVVLDGVRVHESEVPNARRGDLGLPDVSETLKTPDEDDEG